MAVDHHWMGGFSSDKKQKRGSSDEISAMY